MPWVIFDADNTLWAVEPLYDEARRALCSRLANHGVDPQEAERFQRTRDAALFGQYGYDRTRFPRSFHDTVSHFVGTSDRALLDQAARLGRSVFVRPPRPFQGVDVTLATLRRAGFELGVITAGDPVVQRERLDEFPLINQFARENIAIVERKNEETLRAYCQERQVDIPQSWMVGDSIRSDVIPAHALGLNTVYVEHPNWHAVERENQILPPGVLRVRSIAAVPDIVLEMVAAE